MKKISNKIALAIGFSSLIIIVLMGYIINYEMSKEIKKEAEESLRLITLLKGSDLENKMENIVQMEKALESMVLYHKDIDDIIRNKDKMNSFKDETAPIFMETIRKFNNKSGWIVFNSKTVDGGHIISFSEKDGKYNREADYDAVAEGYDKDEWWAKAVENGSNWSSPYFWEPWQANVISFSKPVYLGDKLLGVAGGEIFVDDFKKELSGIKIYETGYMTLMDANFNVLYHPNKDVKNLREVANGSLNFLADQIKDSKDKFGIIPYKFDGKDKLMAFLKLENGWIVTANPVLKEMYKGVISTQRIILIIGFILLFLSIIIAIILGNSISKQLVIFMTKFKESSEGDLSVRFNSKTKDEINILAMEFNNFMTKLDITTKKIKDVFEDVEAGNKSVAYYLDNIAKGNESPHYRILSSSLKDGIIQLQSSVEKISDNIRNQSSSTEESLAALEEIAAATHEIGTNAEKTYEESKNSEIIIEESFKDIENLDLSIKNINESLKIANRKIEELTHLSVSIGDITGVIDSLAEQINMLSLNASIEAARAGEAGRGFAVVANEVKKLADLTNQQTYKINSLVSSIQNEVSSVKNANNDVEKRVLIGIDLAHKVKNNMDTVITISESTKNEIGSIATSTKEQTVAIEEITKAVNNISENSVDIEDIVNNTYKTNIDITNLLMNQLNQINGLVDLIEELKKDLSFFKNSN